MTRVPERWDRGKWDQAHWDGQLGLDAAAGSIVVGAQTAVLRTGRRLTAQPGAIVLTGNAATLTVTAGSAAYVLTADPGAITLSGTTVTLRVARRISAQPGAILVAGQTADLIARQAHTVMIVAAGSIVLTGHEALLTAAVTPPIPAPVLDMRFKFGIPRASRPLRW